VFSGIADNAALNKLINDCAAGVALASGVDLPTVFDSAVDTRDALLDNKARMDTMAARLGPICDGAIDGLAALLDANSCTPAAFDLQHVVLEGRGHCWLCSECCRLPGVADAVVRMTGGGGRTTAAATATAAGGGGGGGSGGGGGHISPAASARIAIAEERAVTSGAGSRDRPTDDHGGKGSGLEEANASVQGVLDSSGMGAAQE
jgi:hypothetical protein